MRFYKNPNHRFYAGVDLHARSMYVCILDQQRASLFTKTSPDPSCFDWTSELRRAFFTYAKFTSDVEAALDASRLLTGTVSGQDRSSLNGREWGTQDGL